MNFVEDAFAKQVDWCERLGSPFTARVLRTVARDLPAPVRDWAGDPVADALPLRVAGALHALVLSRRDPQLAACYPPHAPDGIEAEAIRALAEHSDVLTAFLADPPQTNEVGRAAILTPGFLTIADQAKMPLSLLEVGASAGLNLRWDRYRYDFDGARWGVADSPVRLAPAWSGPHPPLDATVSVVARAGCDLAPIDVTDLAARLRLRAYVWADQTERRARLDAAIGLALLDPVPLAKSDAAAWLHEALPAALGPDHVTVVYHSVVWHYLPPAQQSFIIRTIAAAAATGHPLAWLRYEPPAPGEPMGLTLRLWPGGGWQDLAEAHPHGASVAWR